MRIVTVALSAATRCVERNSFVRKAHGFSAHTIFALCAHNFRAVRIEDFLKAIAEKIGNDILVYPTLI